MPVEGSRNLPITATDPININALKSLHPGIVGEKNDLIPPKSVIASSAVLFSVAALPHFSKIPPPPDSTFSTLQAQATAYCCGALCGGIVGGIIGGMYIGQRIRKKLSEIAESGQI
jgi:hypothetical protein